MDTPPPESVSRGSAAFLESLLANDKRRRIVTILLPWLVGWVVAVVQVLAGYDTLGLKISQFGSLPPFLMIGLALDGQGLSLAIGLVGSIAVAAWFMLSKRQAPSFAILRRHAASEAAQPAAVEEGFEQGAEGSHFPSARHALEQLVSRADLPATARHALEQISGGFDLPPTRRPAVWQLIGGQLLLVFGTVLSFWIYARSLISQALINLGAQSAPPEISGLILGTVGFFALSVVAALALATGIFLAIQGVKKF